MLVTPLDSLLSSRIILPDTSNYMRKSFGLSCISPCNPALLEVEAASHAWFSNYDVLSSRRQEKFQDFRLGLLASLWYPEANEDRLRVALDSLLWLFAFDDMADLGDFKLEGLKRAIEITMDVLRNPDAPQPKLTIAATLHSFFGRMRQNGNPQAIRHFTEAIESYTQAITQEMVDKHAGHIRTFEEYRSYRRDTVGFMITLATLEYAHELNIPDEVLQDPVMMEMSLAASDITAWTNDLYSFPQEHARGQTHNLLFVIMWHNRLELQDAVDHVNQLIEQGVQDFLQAKAKLRSFGPDLDREVARYVQGMEYCIQACIDWSYATTRYFGADGAKVKETCVFNLVAPIMLADLNKISKCRNH